jgi:antirestriction protein ArdC
MWQELGGQVQKGQRGTIIVHWSPMEKEIIGPNGVIETRRYMRPRLHNVFNVDQVSGVDPEKYALPVLSDEQRVQRMDSIIEELGATIRESTNMPTRNGGFGLRAYYSPTDDSISLPPFSTFTEPLGYYQTAMHELVHWTGHNQRLNRLNMNEFGNQEYAYEELVAEIASAMFMAAHNIEPNIQENHGPYLASWIKKLKDDPTALERAMKDAQSAVNYILDISPNAKSKFSNGEKAEFENPDIAVPTEPVVAAEGLASGGEGQT